MCRLFDNLGFLSVASMKIIPNYLDDFFSAVADEFLGVFIHVLWQLKSSIYLELSNLKKIAYI